MIHILFYLKSNKLKKAKTLLVLVESRCASSIRCTVISRKLFICIVSVYASVVTAICLTLERNSLNLPDMTPQMSLILFLIVLLLGSLYNGHAAYIKSLKPSLSTVLNDTLSSQM